MNASSLIRLLVCAALLPLAGAIHAQEAAASAPKPTVKPVAAPGEPITVTVVGDAANRVGQVVYVTIVVKGAHTDPIVVKNMTVSIDGAAREKFQTLECNLQRRGEFKLTRETALEQTCRFDMKEAGAFTVASLLALDVRLKVEVGLEQFGSVQYFPVLVVRAPELSVFIGGIVGALILAVFVVIERLLKNPGAREKWVATLVVTLTMGLRGGLMAVIALLLSKTTQGAGSPITLTVTDFGGGILIGLFSYPLASWISSTLKLDSMALGQASAPRTMTEQQQAGTAGP